MRKLILILLLLLSGCTTWQQKRTMEIETALKNGEITKAEYLDLKIKLDQSKAILLAGTVGKN